METLIKENQRGERRVDGEKSADSQIDRSCEKYAEQLRGIFLKKNGLPPDASFQMLLKVMNLSLDDTIARIHREIGKTI